jgi:polyphosphate kinase 2 (PPK2 family)
MLEKIDLSQRIEKKEYKRIMPVLQNRLYLVQKASWDAGLPVIILFEGWDAAGKGTSIQGLTAPLDPRGFKLYPIRAARTYEKKRPWLWRFWQKLPARGEWAIFDRSWYGRVLVERVEKLVPESEWRRAYRDIVDFERTLFDDGHILVKFFLHIGKGEQRRRFEKLLKDPLTAWHVAQEDWEHHRHYDEWLLAYEEAFERTETEWGPWTIVEATDRRFTRVKMLRTIIRTLEERLGIQPEPLEVAGGMAEITAGGQEEADDAGPVGLEAEEEDAEEAQVLAAAQAGLLEETSPQDTFLESIPGQEEQVSGTS